MAEPESALHRRDLVRAALLSGALVTFLLAAAAAGAHHKEMRAFYYATRLVRAEAEDASGWADRLAALGPEAASACRWAYRRASDPEVKEEAALALGECAGLTELLALVEREGIDTPAEKALVELLCEWPDLPPEGAEILEEDDSPPPDSLKIVTLDHSWPCLRYAVGNYEVEVTRSWGRDVGVLYRKDGTHKTSWGRWLPSGVSVEVIRCLPEGEDIHFGRLYGRYM